MKNLVKIAFLVFGVLFLYYLSIPAPAFPKTLWDFESSTEPADHETPMRRGYYTNLTREQLMSHYSQEFGWGERLNYPPEEAQTIIRDQTKATFLEEIVHPMRESLFVAGNERKADEGSFEVGGKIFKQKVIVKYVDSSISVRFAVGISTIILMWVLGVEYIKSAERIKRWISR